MPAANLQGLNIVHPPQEHSDPQDLLLGQAYPDLTAQLDLWTNLSFDSEEPIGSRHDEHKNSLKLLAEEEEEEVRSPVNGEKAVRDGHVNVVTPANVPTNASASTANSTAVTQAFDLNSFLATFGLDAFASHPQLQQQQQPTIAPSLAQLLALHPNHNHAYPPMGLPHYTPPVSTTSTAAAASFTRNTSPGSEESYVPAKRARTRKASITNEDSLDYQDEESASTSNPTTTPLSASEDKRRRNTAASARFRLKKKEREAALEGKAKELETKVSELERECEGLRRENGWLKGLVVGVTGAAQGPNGGQGLTASTPQPGPISTGTKRRREETEKD